MADSLSQDDVIAQLSKEETKIARLERCPLKPVEVGRLRTIRNFSNGIFRRSGACSDLDQLLIREFLQIGAKAILSTGAMRAGDFLNNQLRGRWAEEVVRSMQLSDFAFTTFGPSGAAMPGQEDHRKIITTYREIELIEGKRPDLVIYDRTAWTELSEPEIEKVKGWPDRLLDEPDLLLLRRSRCGVEVKNSTWHFARRREHRASLDDDDAGPLSITVKDEELKKIIDWIRSTGRPVLFFQVLFDEVYCMSFSRMVDGIRNGHVYQTGDYLKDTVTGAGRKVYHRFLLRDTRHRCAFVRFPDQSEARVEVLVNGSVIPYVHLRPAQAYDERQDVVISELIVAENALKVGLPILP
jgi:AccI restriction endonuclease